MFTYNNMGGQQSKSTVLNTVVNEVTSNFIQKNMTSQSATQTIKQNVKIDGATLNCAATIQNDAEVKATVIQKLTSDTQVQMINKVMGQLENKLKSAQKAETGFLATPEGQKAVVKVKNNISNKLKANIDIEKINKQILEINATQIVDMKNVVIDPCGISITKTALPGGCTVPCPVGNEMKSTIIAQQITNDIVKTIQDDEATTDLVNNVTNQQSSKATGPIQEIGKAVSDFMKALSAPMVISGIVAVLLIIAMLYFLMSPAGQKAATRATNVVKSAPIV
jgi:cobalamin biosynthesis Mg chelatase CobN